MDAVTAWCGFLGAWLVVAGSIYQAALELQAEEEASARLHDLRDGMQSIPRDRPASRWWWLLPPVAFELARRRRNRDQEAMVASLGDEDHEVLVRYFNKATGWFYVGIGAFLLAIRETGGLVDEQGWNHLAAVALVVTMLVLSVANTVARQHRTAQTLARSSRAAAAARADRP